MAKYPRKFIVVLAVVIGLAAAFANANTTSPILSTDGYIQMEPSAGTFNDSSVVALTGNCYQVVGNTDPWIADAITMGQAGKVDVRPSIYDVMRDEMSSFGIKVLMVKITDVQNKTFFGSLVIQQGSKIVSLDSRPSDATAIAVRFNAPIYMSQNLVKQYGEKVC